ncbi:raffinose/stachyose/melibiose transport system permease protein [Paenibacillus sp. DS2015]|uniref:carbohydrate ABC transporter permease n=1 Tax=Paenibacillus sp. DS2015 TaxID=3373917 RepID=UPI003D19AA70
MFVFIPLIEGIRISFTNWNGYSQIFDYIGFDNYKNLFASKLFKVAMINTLLYGVACTILQNVLGLAYALFVDQKFVLRNVVRVIIYMPSIIAGIIMGYMMYGIFQYNGGALNDLAMLFGADKVDWLGNGSRAVWIIIIVNSVQFVGVAMMLFLAGLQSISNSVIEAAMIDGVNRRQMLLKIRLPLLMPAISSSVMINMIGGFKMFSLVFALTNGGPGISTHSMGTAINYLHFGNENAGQAAAAGMVLFALIFVISYFVNTYFRTKEVEV